jgi:hypothetical protein
LESKCFDLAKEKPCFIEQAEARDELKEEVYPRGYVVSLLI